MRFLADNSGAYLPYGRPSEMPGRSGGLLAGLPDDVRSAIRQLLSAGRPVAAGQDIFSQGEIRQDIYSTTNGWVMLYMLMEDGRRQILQFCPPGSILLGGTATATPSSFGAQALTPVTVSTLSPHDLCNLMTCHPMLALRFLQQLTQDRDRAFGRLASIGRQSARERVARLLLELYLSAAPGRYSCTSTQVFLPLTQEHIGDATGLTGVHVNRVLRELRDDGILSFNYRKLRIMDLGALATAADIDPRLQESLNRLLASQPETLRTRAVAHIAA